MSRDLFKQPKVVIVDDDSGVGEALADSVRSLQVNVHLFQSAEECLQSLEKERCNLLITDFNMPEVNGLELLRRARKVQPRLPVIMMTGYGGIPLAVKAIKSGAVEFIEKPLSEEVILPLIRETLGHDQHGDMFSGAPLTTTEQVVLNLIVSGKSNKEMAYDLGKSIRTIENHRQRIMKKLGAQSTGDLVRIALGE